MTRDSIEGQEPANGTAQADQCAEYVDAQLLAPIDHDTQQGAGAALLQDALTQLAADLGIHIR